MRTSVCSVFLACVALPAFALPVTDVYFFGDSLTDTGNVMQVYAGIPPDLRPPGAPAVIPGPPYDAQGRASNGLVYADVLAQGLGFDALAATRGGNNFAFGGARTRYQIFGPPFPGVIEQVALFTGLPGPADPNALYVVWAGSNNLQDIFIGRATDVLGNPIPDPLATLADIEGMLRNLHAEGARNFLVPNVPNLGRVPRLRELGGDPLQAAAFIQFYNGLFENTLRSLEAELAEINLIRFDSFAQIDDIVSEFDQLGLNTSERCYEGDDIGFTGGGPVCPNPDEYFFWDGIHPTSLGHRFIGERMLAAVLASTVAEPPLLWLLALPLVLGWLANRKSGRAPIFSGRRGRDHATAARRALH